MSRSKFIMSIITTIFSLLLFTVVSFAWFAMSVKNEIGGIDFSTISPESNHLNTIISQDGEVITGNVIALTLLPGQSVSYTIALQNSSADDISVSISIRDIVTGYLANEDSDYVEGRYVNVSTEEIVTTYLDNIGGSLVEKPIDQTYFNQFISSATNAIKCLITESMDDNNYQKYLAEYTVEDQKTITVVANSAATLYLKFYFDPYKYSIYDGVRLENSNPYMNQKISFEVITSE